MRFLQKHLLASWQAFSHFAGKYLISRAASLSLLTHGQTEKAKLVSRAFQGNGRKLHLIQFYVSYKSTMLPLCLQTKE